MIALFDLDGCICDDRHRLHLWPQNGIQEDDAYRAYHDAMDGDTLINGDQLGLFAANPEYVIFIITSRPERYRKRTLEWIHKHCPFIEGKLTNLWMRPPGDHSPSPQLKVDHLIQHEISPDTIGAAFDDRQDVLDAYFHYGLPKCLCHRLTYPVECVKAKTRGVPEILKDMAKTFEERNAVYKDNYYVTAQVLGVLFPNGVPADVVCRPEFHILVTKVSKLTRFVNTGLTHVDSIHDDAVYSAMIEYLITK